MNNIGALCQHPVVTIDSDCSIQEAAQHMREHHVGALVVTTEEQGLTANAMRVCGVITDRDLAVEALARGLDPQEISVGTLISGKAVAVPAQASVSDAIGVMRQEGVRRLLVTGAQRQLTGILSLDDVVGALAAELGEVAESMRRGLAREALTRRPLGDPGPVSVQVPLESLPGPWRSLAASNANGAD
jgi:CBS domain-containing protein